MGEREVTRTEVMAAADSSGTFECWSSVLVLAMVLLKSSNVNDRCSCTTFQTEHLDDLKAEVVVGGGQQILVESAQAKGCQ